MTAAARDAWGNPSSVHAHGRRARARLEDARASVAALAACDPRDVLFTSGGTEANNLALRSAVAWGNARAREREEGRTTVLTSQIEHPSVLRVVEALAAEGAATLRLVTVLPDGTLDLGDLARAVAECAGFLVLALQAVNHETGVIQPVGEAMRIVRAGDPKRAWVHVDAVQAFGRTEDVVPGADSRSLAGHKIRGPKGIGALFTQPGATIVPLLLGGAQERGVRPGTTDPVAAAGLGVAAAHALTGHERYARLAALRDRIEVSLVELGGSVNGDGARAPHVTNVSFDGWRGAELVAALDLEGVSVSSGSACSAGTIEPSTVLRAMVGEARAASAVRISLGEETTNAEVEGALGAFARVLRRT
jgi:cysteine desulfurase